MKRAIALTVSVATLLLGACAEEEGADRPGNPAVYDRIAAETDCDALQAEFDQASANHDRVAAGSEQAEWSTAYMEAALDRMTELDCPGGR